MRMWMINPEQLCDTHLLGEHFEIHKHRHNFVKKHSISGRISPIVQIEPNSMKTRHDILTIEMEKRFNKKYNSPYEQPDLSYLKDNERNAVVNIDISINDLINRCPKCKERILSMNYNIMNDKEINLERILEEQFPYYHQWKCYFSEKQINFILDAMRDACEQTILLCNENAKTETLKLGLDIEIIDEDSILNTKNQIKL